MNQKFQFDWYDEKDYHTTGSEMFGKDFTVKLYKIDKEKYTIKVFQDKKEVCEENNIQFAALTDAKLKSEEILQDCIDGFIHKIGYHR